MSVDLTPPELGFKRPFTHEVSQVLRLHNPNSESVAFKVKTTAPKQYCVRPNSGRIEPGGDVEVQVLLQAMKEDPPPDARCRDKFLVQSVAIAKDTAEANVTQIWTNIEQTARGSIQEKKIRVNFLPADGSVTSGTTAPPATNGVHQDQPPAYSNMSPSPIPVTPQRATSGATSDYAKSPETPTDQSTMTSAIAGVSSATGIPQSDLQRQLDEAKATISRLQSQAAESASGLRQRVVGKTATADSAQTNSSTALKNAPPGGVQVPIVAALCILCFLIAYIFF